MCLVSGRDRSDEYPPARKTIITERSREPVENRASYVSTSSRRRVIEVDEPRRSSRRVIEVDEPRRSSRRVVEVEEEAPRRSKVKHIYYSPNASYEVLSGRSGQEVMVIQEGQSSSHKKKSSSSRSHH